MVVEDVDSRRARLHAHSDQILCDLKKSGAKNSAFLFCNTKIRNKSLIKPQNYTGNAKLFNLGVIITRSICPGALIAGLTAESRNCFHIQVIRYILPLDPAIKSKDDRFHAPFSFF